MASLYAFLLSAAFIHLACSSPQRAGGHLTFAAHHPLGTPYSRPDTFKPVQVSGSNSGAGEPVLESFVSFSIEFAFFPDFAGNKTKPNIFTNNLLTNLGIHQGTKPNIRVGGNTQYAAPKNMKKRVCILNLTWLVGITRCSIPT